MRIAAAVLWGVLSSLLLASLPVFGNPVYSVIDVGTLGGSSATGYAISSSGAVAGYAQTPAGYQNAFSYNGQFTPLTAAGALSSQANGINSSGVIAGTVYTTNGAVAGIWNGTSFSAIASPDSYAMGINDQGWVAGASQGDAYLDRNGVFTNLGTLPGGTWSSAYAVNGTGQVAGYGGASDGYFHAFVWSENSGMVDLGTLGGSSSYGLGINAAGDVAGSSTDSSGFLKAFLWTHAGLQNLGTLSGANSSMGYGINASNNIVGYSGGHAFLWNNGIMTDLNSLIPLNSGWELDAAYAINDLGQIAGEGTYNGQAHAFLLNQASPVVIQAAQQLPEPATASIFFLLTAGWLSGACYHRVHESRNVRRAAQVAHPRRTEPDRGRLG